MQSSPSPPRAPPPPATQQPSAYKHFCRVCNKGFTCGSALGGHMRAHGVSDGDGLGADDDDNDDNDDDDDELVDEAVRHGRGRGGSDDRWNAGGASSSGAATHVYALRTNPNRLTRSRQVCKNCRKEFTSWEHFLEHGKCSSGEDDDADHSLQSFSSPPDADVEDNPAPAAGWSKGKRSRRVKPIGLGIESSPSASACAAGVAGEEEDLAKCLVMLSSSNVQQTAVAEAEQESSASASREDRTPISFIEPATFAPYTAMLPPAVPAPAPQYVSSVPRRMFECKACKKVFSSHQALGGHRASHKKVKGCFAAKLDNNNVGEPSRQAPEAHRDVDDQSRKVNTNAAYSDAKIRNVVDAVTNGDANAGTSDAAAAELSMAITPMEPAIAALAAAPLKKKGKMHECSVCHRLFTSGQALGGHKRCHWLTSSPADDHVTACHPLANDMVVTACHPLAFQPMPADAPEPAVGLSIAANPTTQLVTSIAAAAIRSKVVVGGSSFHLDAAPPAYIPSPAMPSQRNKETATTGSQNANDHAVGLGAGAGAAEDEADSSSTVKRARLSDLKDVSMAGETTPWLQVGIGSSSRGGGGGGDDTDKE